MNVYINTNIYKPLQWLTGEEVDKSSSIL